MIHTPPTINHTHTPPHTHTTQHIHVIIQHIHLPHTHTHHTTYIYITHIYTYHTHTHTAHSVPHTCTDDTIHTNITHTHTPYAHIHMLTLKHLWVNNSKFHSSSFGCSLIRSRSSSPQLFLGQSSSKCGSIHGDFVSFSQSTVI